MQEINDLKNLVLQSLDAHGVLGQIRAQLRSSVFKIIESQESQSKANSSSQFFWQNEQLKKLGEDQNGLNFQSNSSFTCTRSHPRFLHSL